MVDMKGSKQVDNESHIKEIKVRTAKASNKRLTEVLKALAL